MTPVAPRIVNNVSYVMRINHESHFCVAGAVCWRNTSVAPDVSCVMWITFCAAGAVFGDVGETPLLLRAL